MKYVLIIGLIVLVALMGCTITPTQTDNNSPTILAPQNDLNAKLTQAILYIDKVEVIHFHGNNQCSSCIAVGSLAEETVNTYFSEELKNGKITFSHINYDLPENKELKDKYQVTGSSLWIGVYATNGFHKETNNDVWYKIGNPTDYKTYLSGLLTKRLQGILK
ncbi:MAG: nitrophenyl compound nitroreductase subunit ArsF family protein [archaeon]|jgi:hypothetical protein